MSDRPVRIVLDTSAIISYTHGSIDVGEVIAEVDDEYATVALPVLCLLEAHRVAADHDRLMVLVNRLAASIRDSLTTNPPPKIAAVILGSIAVSGIPIAVPNVMPPP